MANFFKNKGNNGYNNDINGYYGGYDNNQYISDGHDYFNNDYDYMGNEYGFNGQQQYNGNMNAQDADYYGDGYYDNDGYGYDDYSNGYGYSNQQGMAYPSVYDEYQFQQNSGYYGGSMCETGCIPTADISFEDTFVLQNQYFGEDDEEKLFTLKDFLSLGICIVFAFVLAYLITTYVAQHTMVDGHSMDYNLNNGDILIIDKLSYNFNDPERFDIIVFPVLQYKNTYYIKRIIGLPNETIEIDDDGNIYVNNKLLNENYGYETITNPGQNSYVELGDDEYFVLGDNRNHSDDSRNSVGNVKRENIVGKAIFRLWKIDNFGQIDNLKNAKVKTGVLSLEDVQYEDE